jgi:hypothetical protein
MTRPEKLTLAATVALLAYLYYVNRDDTATVTIDPRSLGDHRFDPFTHWRHDHPQDWYRPFPLAPGPHCLPLIYQSQDHGLALDQGGVPDASYPQ